MGEQTNIGDKRNKIYSAENLNEKNMAFAPP
jgi:hypothetical protein